MTSWLRLLLLVLLLLLLRVRELEAVATAAKTAAVGTRARHHQCRGAFPVEEGASLLALLLLLTAAGLL